MIRTNIHLSKQQRAALKRISKKTGITPAELVRRAIDFYVEYMTGRKIKEQRK